MSSPAWASRAAGSVSWVRRPDRCQPPARFLASVSTVVAAVVPTTRVRSTARPSRRQARLTLPSSWSEPGRHRGQALMSDAAFDPALRTRGASPSTSPACGSFRESSASGSARARPPTDEPGRARELPAARAPSIPTRRPSPPPGDMQRKIDEPSTPRGCRPDSMAGYVRVIIESFRPLATPFAQSANSRRPPKVLPDQLNLWAAARAPASARP